MSMCSPNVSGPEPSHMRAICVLYTCSCVRFPVYIYTHSRHTLLCTYLWKCWLAREWRVCRTCAENPRLHSVYGHTVLGSGMGHCCSSLRGGTESSERKSQQSGSCCFVKPPNRMDSHGINCMWLSTRKGTKGWAKIFFELVLYFIYVLSYEPS